MTGTDLISKVKFEAKSNATSEFDAWILQVINEEYFLLAQKHNYSDNIKEGTLTCSAGVAYVAVPSDFIRLKSNARLKFYISGSQDYKLLTLASEYQTKLVIGVPQFYEIKNSRVYLFPYSQVLSTHRIDITYYKSPSAVVGATTIPDQFANIIFHKVMTRLLVYKDSKAAAFFAKQAEEKFEESV